VAFEVTFAAQLNHIDTECGCVPSIAKSPVDIVTFEVARDENDQAFPEKLSLLSVSVCPSPEIVRRGRPLIAIDVQLHTRRIRKVELGRDGGVHGCVTGGWVFFVAVEVYGIDLKTLAIGTWCNTSYYKSVILKITCGGGYCRCIYILCIKCTRIKERPTSGTGQITS
jgi:hypothetical protein